MQPHKGYRRALPAGRTILAGALGLLGLVVILLLAGCNYKFFSNRSAPVEEFWAGVRPTSGDTERLLRNFRFLKAAGRTQLALKELEEAYQRDPDNLKIVDVLAQCYEELGYWDRAQEVYQEALAREPDNPALVNNLCFSYYLAGRYDKAESCFRELLKRHPENAKARNNLGLVLVKMGRQEEAYQLWREQEGEAVALKRLNQALAALGLPPRTSVARASKTPKSQPAQAAAEPAASAAAAVTAPVPAQASTSPVPVASSPAPQPSEPPPATTPPEAPPAPLVRAPQKELPASFRHHPRSHLAYAAEKISHQSPAPERRPETPVEEKPDLIPTPAAAKEKMPVATTAPEAPAKKAEVAPAAPATPKRHAFLTAEERVNTRLEIKNGNGVRRFAALHRTWLTMEGFRVADIGNYRDFGQKRTLILYKPEAERVARVLQKDFFPQAVLKPGPSLGKNAEVRIILGHDQIARKKQIAARIALLDLRAQLALLLASSGHSSQAKAKPDAVGPADLKKAKIEVRNGNGVRGMARKFSARLKHQGFRVVRLGNHVNFGLQQTRILYRPKAAAVAQALGRRYLRTARLEETGTLPKGVDVKVILGQDLALGFSHLAKLAH
ncbi:MAG: LytR C-terminal domain-containing protein [Deltaproteobacteria bacterium]|nr:LytR C-terminal domain-containing protein [Deltaproteobacteria bacterium]